MASAALEAAATARQQARREQAAGRAAEAAARSASRQARAAVAAAAAQATAQALREGAARALAAPVTPAARALAVARLLASPPAAPGSSSSSSSSSGGGEAEDIATDCDGLLVGLVHAGPTGEALGLALDQVLADAREAAAAAKAQQASVLADRGDDEAAVAEFEALSRLARGVGTAGALALVDGALTRARAATLLQVLAAAAEVGGAAASSAAAASSFEDPDTAAELLAARQAVVAATAHGLWRLVVAAPAGSVDPARLQRAADASHQSASAFGAVRACRQATRAMAKAGLITAAAPQSPSIAAAGQHALSAAEAEAAAAESARAAEEGAEYLVRAATRAQDAWARKESLYLLSWATMQRCLFHSLFICEWIWIGRPAACAGAVRGATAGRTRRVGGVD
jgi:hypothetical protein